MRQSFLLNRNISLDKCKVSWYLECRINFTFLNFEKGGRRCVRVI